jgi:catechol 2,3-dioxygenase-like lactoylglutathione lyase family enzyme
MAVKEVALISIPVSDPSRAKEFYVDKVGLELVRDDEDVPMPGLRWIQVAPKAGTPSMVLATWFDSMPAGSLQGLVLRTDDIHTDYQQMITRGVEFDGPPERQSYATGESVFHDPDGNRLILQQA